jgi:pimeloyl-ACP methyl ester carboxylesterase
MKKYSTNTYRLKSGNSELQVVYDYTSPINPLVILAPPYEGTIRSNLLLMLYLINNDYNIIRFDYKNHRGISDGKFIDFTSSSAIEDLNSVISFISDSKEFKSKPSIVGISISSRFITRILSKGSTSIDSFISIFGVVHMNDTIGKASNNKYVPTEMIKSSKKEYDRIRIIKYEINGNNFIPNLYNNNLVFLEESLKEAEKIVTPTYFICSKEDDWVDYEEVLCFCESIKSSKKQIYLMPDCIHEFHKNFIATRNIFIKAVELLNLHYHKSSSNGVLEPSLPEFMEINSVEREKEYKIESKKL